MQVLPPALSSHLAQEVTTLATCWKITRKDGAVFCFTDHDTDVAIDANIYLASSGITPSAVSSQLGLAVDNLELTGMLQNDGMSEADILAGKFDHAAVTVFLVNYESPVDGNLQLNSGWLGEVSLKDGQFVAEIRGVSSLLQQSVGEVFTNNCRAKLGDNRCKLNLTAFTVTGTLTATDAAYSFTDSSRAEVKSYFAYGLVTFTSGANNGLSMEVREFAAGKFTLFLPMPNVMAAGDTYISVAGCDKLFDTCSSRFANALNFRGEPHVPGMDRLLETSATRSK